MFQRVAAFHVAFGHLVGQTPQLPDTDLRALRRRLIAEELDEYHRASEVQDRIEIADALADLLYVLAGTAVAYGIAPNGEFESPYEGIPAPVANVIADVLAADFEVYGLAEDQNDLEKIGSAIMMMMMDIFAIAWHLHIPINAVFAEVHRSNLSKMLPDGSVLRRADGKILKAPQWSPPDLKSILDRTD